MAAQSVLDDLQDSTVDILAPEYHRLNRPDERQHLASIEAFLSAAAAAFLIPYLAQLAKHAADATREALAAKFTPANVNDHLIANATTLMSTASEEDHYKAIRVAEASYYEFVGTYDIPDEVPARCVRAMTARIVEVRVSSKDRPQRAK